MRNTKIVEVKADGRDQGKKYLITEMPAARAERWAVRAFLALAHGGVELPDDYESMGIAGIAALGFGQLAKLPFAEATWLMDEMMTCVQSQQEAGVRPLVENDIEEVSTRFLLRAEVFALHTGFSLDAAVSKLTSAASATKGS